MKQQLLLNLDPQIKPLFLRIATAVRLAVKQGVLKAGEVLPSARNLAQQLATNRHTIMAAYQELIAQGWLESSQRRSYRVVTTLPIESSQILAQSTHKAVNKFSWPAKVQSFSGPGIANSWNYEFSFVGGVSDINAFPFKEFRSCMADCLSRPGLSDLGYGSKQGDELFLTQISEYLRRKRGLTNKALVSVNGSQEALFLIAHLMLEPGDKVAVEALGYKPAWDAFKAAGAELLGVRQHEAGIDLQHLEGLFRAGGVKILYLTPLHQYPTTIVIPIRERIEIYRLAAEFNVIIVEDDYDHEFHYDSQPLAPMAADDPCGLVIYLSTFSKIMFPGCRIGVMAIDESLLEAVVNYRTVMNHKPNVLIQNAIGRWMEYGGFERHLRRMTRLYRQRRDAMDESLRQLQQQGFKLDYKLPAGGMALWVDIGQQANDLSQLCHQHSIYLQPESHFHLRPQQDQNRHIRLGFAGMDAEKSRLGLQQIFHYHQLLVG